MYECCANCKYFKELYIPSKPEFEMLPEGLSVCSALGSDRMTLLVDGGGFCEIYSPTRTLDDNIEGQTSIDDVFDHNGKLKTYNN